MAGGEKVQKKTRRGETKHNGLKKEFFSKIKQEYHDIDYVDKLSEQEKDWLSRFMNEDLGANLKENRESGKAINTDPKHIRDIWARNNARNADLYSKAKATGMLDTPDAIPDDSYYESFEDAVIDQLDLSKQIDSIFNGSTKSRKQSK